MHAFAWFKLIGAVLAIPVGLLLLDQILRWMERRDWLYYKRKRPSSSTRAVMSVFQELVQPEVRHVWEDQRQRATQTDDEHASDE